MGDTVVWLNKAGANYVQSYGGEWSSPTLNPGDSFSFTFTNAGFYAYRTGVACGPGQLMPGTITVDAWTGAPPAVTIITPLDGSVFYSEPDGVQASVTNAEDIVQIQVLCTHKPHRHRNGRVHGPFLGSMVRPA